MTQLPDETDQKIDESSETSSSACTIAGGTCLTGSRMCPGFALMGGWLVAYPFFLLTGFRTFSIVIGIVVSLGLITGMHTRIWRAFKQK